MSDGSVLQIIPLKDLYLDLIEKGDKSTQASTIKKLVQWARSEKSSRHQLAISLMPEVATLMHWVICPNCRVVIQPSRRHWTCEEKMRAKGY